MDAKLKQKLNEAVDAAITRWKEKGMPVRQLGVSAPKTGSATPINGVPTPKALTEEEVLNRWLCDLVRRDLWRTASWRQVQNQAAMDLLGDIFRAKLKPRKKAGDPNQMLIPGYEALPARIPNGRRAGIDIREASVRELLLFEMKYQLRSQRDVRRAEELRRLAQEITPFADTSLTVAEAQERARKGDLPTIALVTKKKAGK